MVDTGGALLGQSQECVGMEMEGHGETFVVLELRMIKGLKGNSKCLSQLVSFRGRMSP